ANAQRISIQIDTSTGWKLLMANRMLILRKDYFCGQRNPLGFSHGEHQCNSGNTIKNNTIEDAGWGIYLPGGQYNKVTGNTIKNCGEPIRATQLWYNYPSNFWPTLKARIDKIYPYYQSSIWKSKYPEAAYVLDGKSPASITNTILNGKPDFIKPRGNVIQNNVYINCKSKATYNEQVRLTGTVSGNTN
ncbi:right-handed parallel beta-helix repeat-containing protein, partial [Clostridium sp.]|uniref:NosD domain-containing protein n=1 Tax=Clostridium sp. TaxID=1506 RepID=UPI001B5EE5DB